MKSACGAFSTEISRISVNLHLALNIPLPYHLSVIENVATKVAFAGPVKLSKERRFWED
jgi:hypothetical protein